VLYQLLEVHAERGDEQARHDQAQDQARAALAHSQPASRYDAAVRAMPASRSTCGAYPSSRRALSIEKARLLVQKSTRRRCSGGSMPSGTQSASHRAPASWSGQRHVERQHASARVPRDQSASWSCVT
jgi:hypothetical protein